MNKIYVFYNAHTLEIIIILKPILNNIDIEEFIQSRLEYEESCKGLCREDIKYIVADSEEYDYYRSNTKIRTEMYIDCNTEQFVIKVIEDLHTGINSTYNTQEFKRDYSIENILDMYHNDYINFNLRNVALSNNGIDVGFKYVSDLNIRTKMLNKRWKNFYTDPYLEESSQDKLILGKSIRDIGTYYPIILCKDSHSDNGTVVLEGTHRVTSLKLLQAYGELPMDYKILCITLPFTYEDRGTAKMHTKINEPIRFRNVIEVGYGAQILNDKALYSKAMESIAADGYSIINSYTYEYPGLTWRSVLAGIDLYPHWLRDLIYVNREQIRPSKIVNDEAAFMEWLKGGD